MKLRPHHLLCTQGFSGKGYSAEFVECMTVITNTLRSAPETIVEIVFSTDDICEKCPMKIGEDLCEHNDKVKLIDKKVIDYFRLEPKVYVYKGIIKQINSKMTSRLMDDICGGCSWYKSSDCSENILTNR